MSSEEMGIEPARKVLGPIADRARYAGQVTYLTRNGRRIAAVVPLNRIKETAVAMPHPTVWEDASKAFEKAQSVYASLPTEAQRAVDALGNLTSVYEGYGESDE
ncbi:MAG: hypothetical protein JWO67_4016 [Streptosporangiaceae bacterium]|nr:hypothetical protein [Streptosporangiaceae bacterium]